MALTAGLDEHDHLVVGVVRDVPPVNKDHLVALVKAWHTEVSLERGERGEGGRMGEREERGRIRERERERAFVFRILNNTVEICTDGVINAHIEACF